MMTEVESDAFGVGEIFTEYNDHLEKEAEIKERLREVMGSTITSTHYL